MISYTVSYICHEGSVRSILRGYILAINMFDVLVNLSYRLCIQDYRVRAQDANKKRAEIKRLRQKVLEKNPDEFYFHMKNASLVAGVHHDKVG